MLGRSGGECEAVLSWQVSAASAEVVAGDHEEEEEEEARGTAMEQAKGSGEVSATDARADAGVEEDCWWCGGVVWCVCVQRAWCSEMGRRASWSMQFACRVSVRCAACVVCSVRRVWCAVCRVRCAWVCSG